MYSGLEIQSSDTMSAGRTAVKQIFEALEVSFFSSFHIFAYIHLFTWQKYESQDDDFNKSWAFIKLHYHLHLFDDIQDKGILRGLSTRPNEKLHGPLRKIYLNRTNFKDTGSQV